MREEPLHDFLAGTLSTKGVIDAVAGAYGAFVDTFLDGSGRLRSAPTGNRPPNGVARIMTTGAREPGRLPPF